jgi:hypothetical protein
MGWCKSEGKDSKRDYAKEKLKKGQCESKERDFKEQKRSKVLKKDFRSKVLKNCKGVRPSRIKIEKRSKVKEEIKAHSKIYPCLLPKLCLIFFSKL